jgi:preprotein translocase subunit SecA
MARRALHQETPDLEDEVIEEAVGHSEHVSEEVLAVRKRYNDLYARFKAETDAEHERVLKTGGLHIIGTERHESRRIDNQLRGRSGRQGDPGSTQFFISLEDDLMRLFGSERIGVMVDRLGLKDDEPLTAGLLTKQIESAQKRIEGRNFEARKHVLEYDNVMNRQREVIYGQRRRVLMGEDVSESIRRMADHVIDFAMGRWMNSEDPQEWEWREATNYLENLCLHHGTIEANRPTAEKEDRA